MTSNETPVQAPKRRPIKEGLLTAPLSSLDEVRLKGSKCKKCGEVLFGKTATCPRCSGDELEETVLSKRGILWTYTVIRNRPPGDYKGPNPYVPLVEGIVELPEGIRVLTPIDCEIDKLKIGSEMDLVVYRLFTDPDGSEVIAFKFKPV